MLVNVCSFTDSSASHVVTTERTFLAWLRTSLAFSSIGITITQLFRLNTAMPSQSGMFFYSGFPAALAGSLFLTTSV